MADEPGFVGGIESHKDTIHVGVITDLETVTIGLALGVRTAHQRRPAGPDHPVQLILRGPR